LASAWLTFSCAVACETTEEAILNAKAGCKKAPVLLQGGETVKSLSTAFLADLEEDWRHHGKLGADSSGYVEITDPPNSASNTASSSTVTSRGSNGASLIDNASTFSGMLAGLWAHDHAGLLGIGSGAHTTLGYSEDGGDAGGTLLHTAGPHSANRNVAPARAHRPLSIASSFI
jgi:hypothetical protein